MCWCSSYPKTAHWRPCMHTHGKPIESSPQRFRPSHRLTRTPHIERSDGHNNHHGRCSVLAYQQVATNDRMHSTRTNLDREVQHLPASVTLSRAHHSFWRAHCTIACKRSDGHKQALHTDWLHTNLKPSLSHMHSTPTSSKHSLTCTKHRHQAIPLSHARHTDLKPSLSHMHGTPTSSRHSLTCTAHRHQASTLSHARHTTSSNSTLTTHSTPPMHTPPDGRCHKQTRSHSYCTAVALVLVLVLVLDDVRRCHTGRRVP
jgi:hypothetical protein